MRRHRAFARLARARWLGRSSRVQVFGRIPSKTPARGELWSYFFAHVNPGPSPQGSRVQERVPAARSLQKPNALAGS